MNDNNQISYIEFPSKDLAVTKAFFSTVFEWSFTDFGPEYTAFTNATVNGGFYKSEQSSSVTTGSALIVILCDKLKQTQQKIEQAGGSIVKPTFAFPGGHRFHFTDPNGNEYAAWSDTE
jgi:predicted enzyme related to lactoylglutathione lyase